MRSGEARSQSTQPDQSTSEIADREVPPSEDRRASTNTTFDWTNLDTRFTTFIDSQQREVTLPTSSGVHSGRTHPPTAPASANKRAESSASEFPDYTTLVERTVSATKRQDGSFGPSTCTDFDCVTRRDYYFDTQHELDQHDREHCHAVYQHIHGQPSNSLQSSQPTNQEGTPNESQKMKRVRKACDSCKMRKVKVSTFLNMRYEMNGLTFPV
jgi:hypothetical protein